MIHRQVKTLEKEMSGLGNPKNIVNPSAIGFTIMSAHLGIADAVLCSCCFVAQLVRIGAERCPSCLSLGTLAWTIEGLASMEPQEVYTESLVYWVKEDFED